MKQTTIDNIVRGYLFSAQRPIHYYVQALHYALECLQELNYDTLPNIRSTLLTVNAFNEVTLPDDYVDLTFIGEKVGQYIKPLVLSPTYNRLPNLDDQSAQIPYARPENIDFSSYFNVGSGYWFSGFVNDHGEHLGRHFGRGNGLEKDGYKVIEERNVIQLNTSIREGCIIYIEYLNFDDTKTSSLVSKYAEKAIKAYIAWQFKEWGKRTPLSEKERYKRMFSNEHRKLRARLNPMGKEEILRVIRNNFKQSIKT